MGKEINIQRERERSRKTRIHFDNEYKTYQEYNLENWRISYLNRIFQGLSLDGKVAADEERFLDIGAGGSGYTIIEAAKKGIRSVGIDFSLEGVRKSRELSGQVLDSTSVSLSSFLVASAEDLPFADNTFTKVASIAVLEHVPDDKRAFDEIARVTKDKGKVFISVPNVYERNPFLYKILGRINDRNVGHLRHYRSEELIKEFQLRGFILDGLTYHAHNIKIVQWLLSMIFPFLQRRDSILWWKLEEIDLRQKDNQCASMITLVMTKKKTR